MTNKNGKLLVSTGKGLIVYRKTASGWIFESDHFLGFSVSMTRPDVRTGKWWACLDHKHWGQKLHSSHNHGKTWEEIPSPKYAEGLEIKPGVKASLKLIWAFASGGNDRPGEILVGTEPGGLFRSINEGNTWDLNQSLWDHPSRQEQWFGGGRNFPGIHSIVIDPRDSNHFYVAISCAGVFETRDNGQTWHVRNKGLKADFLPNPEVEVGQDPHLILSCRSNPDVLWQQNHCGVYRSENGGINWTDVTDEEDKLRYGFALAIEDQDPNVAFVIPASSDQVRVAKDKSLFVARTDDAGKSWEFLKNGLPQANAYDIVLRHALDKSENTLAFGTVNGNLYLSENYGDSWICLNSNLPKVNAVCFG